MTGKRDQAIEGQAASPGERCGAETRLVDRAKELLADPRGQIRFHELIMGEAQRVAAEISDDNFPLTERNVDDANVAARILSYDQVTRDLRIVAALGALWGGPATRSALRLAHACLDQRGSSSGYTVWCRLRWYPSAVLIYSGGVAAIAGGHYGFLYNGLRRTVASDGERTQIARLVVGTVFSGDGNFQVLPGAKGPIRAGSDHVFQLLSPDLGEVVRIGPRFEDGFQEFEILLGLVCADEQPESDFPSPLPIGRAAGEKRSLLEEMRRQASIDQGRWAPLADGFLAGSPERFERAAAKLSEALGRFGRW